MATQLLRELSFDWVLSHLECEVVATASAQELGGAFLPELLRSLHWAKLQHTIRDRQQLQQFLHRMSRIEQAKQALTRLLTHRSAAAPNPTIASDIAPDSSTHLLLKPHQVLDTSRTRESTFYALAEPSDLAIFLYQDEQLRYVNPATEDVSGYTREELLTMDIWDLIDPTTLPRLCRLRQQQKLVFLHHELELVTKDGEERCLDIVATSIGFEGRPAMLGTALDAAG